MKLMVLAAIIGIALIAVDLTEAKRRSKKDKKRSIIHDMDDEAEEDEDRLPDEEKFLVTKTIYLNFTIDDGDEKRVEIGLFGEAAQATVNNFVALAKGVVRKTDAGEIEKFGYKGTVIHRIVRDFVIQGGDVVVGDGSGGKSIYGPTFDDEEFIHSHQSPGYVAMANIGPNSNSSQFYIILVKARHLDNKHVVFGKVTKGLEHIEEIGEVEADDHSFPKLVVKIVSSGVARNVKPYVLAKENR